MEKRGNSVNRGVVVLTAAATAVLGFLDFPVAPVEPLLGISADANHGVAVGECQCRDRDQ